MTIQTRVGRRNFLASSTVVAGGFSLGFSFPYQASAQAPHETQSEAMNEEPCPAATFESKPRPWMVSAKVPCTSSHARTQREHTMHLLGSKLK